MKKLTAVEKRKRRLRTRIKKHAYGRKRLSVFRSDMHIYAQVIDDSQGITLASASTLDKELVKKLEKVSKKEAAALVGQLLGQRAIEKGVKEVVFDRGAYIYHGRIEALANGARQAGLEF